VPWPLLGRRKTGRGSQNRKADLLAITRIRSVKRELGRGDLLHENLSTAWRDPGRVKEDREVLSEVGEIDGDIYIR